MKVSRSTLRTMGARGEISQGGEDGGGGVYRACVTKRRRRMAAK
jgi:hypothetical protein